MAFLKKFEITSLLSPTISQELNDTNVFAKDQQGDFFEKALTDVINNSPEAYKLPFFEADREGYGKYQMRKRSGGRYK